VAERKRESRAAQAEGWRLDQLEKARQNELSKQNAGVSHPPADLDVKSTNLRYWEKVLNKCGLGKRPRPAEMEIDYDDIDSIDELKAAEVEAAEIELDEVVPNQIHTYRSTRHEVSNKTGGSTNNPDFAYLRTRLDSDDPFMGKGHQIHKIRTRKRLKSTNVDWFSNDENVRGLIDSAFPKWRTNSTHLDGAGRWAHVISLYYRRGLPQKTVAFEMRLGRGGELTVREILKRINRVVRGKRADNTGARSRIPTQIQERAAQDGNPAGRASSQTTTDAPITAHSTAPPITEEAAPEKIAVEQEADET
jgi:hypothetical protein